MWIIFLNTQLQISCQKAYLSQKWNLFFKQYVINRQKEGMNLQSDWFTEPNFDFEYKKYQLLGYLQSKQKELNAHKIYPHIEELKSHQHTLENFLNTKNYLDESFRKELIGVNIKTGDLKYKKRNDSVGFENWISIIEYSYKKISGCYLHFSHEAEEIKKEIQLDVLGLLPSYLQEGFLLIRQKSGIFVFNYQLHPVLDSSGEKKFQYHYLENHSQNIMVNENSIKTDLIKRYKNQFSHPVFFQVSSSKDFPIYETILPFTGKELCKWIQ